MKKQLLTIASLSVLMFSDSFASQQEMTDNPKFSLSTLINEASIELELTREQNTRYLSLQDQITGVMISLKDLTEDDILGSMRDQVKEVLPQPFDYQNQDFTILSLHQRNERLSQFLKDIQETQGQIAKLIEIRHHQKREDKRILALHSTTSMDEPKIISVSRITLPTENQGTEVNPNSQNSPVQTVIRVPVQQPDLVQTEVRTEPQQQPNLVQEEVNPIPQQQPNLVQEEVNPEPQQQPNLVQEEVNPVPQQQPNLVQEEVNPVPQQQPNLVQAEVREEQPRAPVYVYKEVTEIVCTGTTQVLTKLFKRGGATTRHHFDSITVRVKYEQGLEDALHEVERAFVKRNPYKSDRGCQAARCSTIPPHLQQYF